MISRKEINDRLSNIYQRIGKEPSEKLHEELEEVFQYKPIDNYYTFVKASLYLHEGKLGNVWETLYGKEHWYFPGPYANLLAKLQYETSVASKHPYEGKVHKILAYYAYIAGQQGVFNEKFCLCDEEFIKEAQECYESETTHKEEMIIKCLSKWKIFTEEEKNSFLDELVGISYNLTDTITGILCLCVKDTMELSGQMQHEYFREEIVTTEPNYGFIQKQVKDSNDKFIIIEDEFLNNKYADFIKNLLSQLGKKANIIKWADTNETELIYYLEKSVLDNKYCNLFASQAMFRYLQATDLQNKVSCLSEYRGEAQMDRLCFGYLGGYVEYISRIYDYDYLNELNKKDRCKFSVIIPARNSAYTLRDTLHTVLNQRGVNVDEYEIIISDNSTGGNSEIKELVDELDDERIVYIKTPVELPLQKSFEFAYGKASGTYIISLGSDDGMLPWALETLKEISKKYPDENIIGWERGFFQWSESASNQKGKFVIPRNYCKGNYGDSLKNGKETLIEQIYLDGSGIYAVPMFYINTAFKRCYLKELLKKSGTILDGYTQDVSMAIKSLLINKHYVFIEYPLTIAGMADSSLGAKMSKNAKTDAEILDNLKAETLRGFGSTMIPLELPLFVVASTEGLFWTELFRNYSKKEFQQVISQCISGHDFKQTFLKLTGTRSRNAVDYIQLLEKLRYNARNLDAELGKWIEEVLYTVATQKLYREDKEAENVVEAYKIGFNENGGLVLDARKFGVNTIQEAVELFQKIVSL